MILKASLACGPSPAYVRAGGGQVLRTMGSRISTRLPRNRLAGFFIGTLSSVRRIGIVSRPWFGANAITSRTGRRLIREFWPGAGCYGVQFGPNRDTGEGFLARLQGNLRVLGGWEPRKSLQRRTSLLNLGACCLFRLSGLGMALNGYGFFCRAEDLWYDESSAAGCKRRRLCPCVTHIFAKPRPWANAIFDRNRTIKTEIALTIAYIYIQQCCWTSGVLFSDTHCPFIPFDFGNEHEHVYGPSFSWVYTD